MPTREESTATQNLIQNLEEFPIATFKALSLLGLLSPSLEMVTDRDFTQPWCQTKRLHVVHQEFPLSLPIFCWSRSGGTHWVGLKLQTRMGMWESCFHCGLFLHSGVLYLHLGLNYCAVCYSSEFKQKSLLDDVNEKSKPWLHCRNGKRLQKHMLFSILICVFQHVCSISCPTFTSPGNYGFGTL